MCLEQFMACGVHSVNVSCYLNVKRVLPFLSNIAYQT